MPKNFGRFDETTTSQTLQSLDDLLGEDPKISAERRADERAKEAFEASEKKKQLKEKTKKMYEKRFERFELAVKRSTSVQRLQAVFLEGFILPNVTKTKEEEEEEAEKIEFFQLPSEVIDPRTGDRLKKANAAKASSSKITESAVERLPGEFRIPIIPYGHVVVPGAVSYTHLTLPTTPYV